MTSASGITSGTTIVEVLSEANGQVMLAAAGGGYSVVNSTDIEVQYRAVQSGATDAILAKFIFTASTSEDIMVKQIALVLANTASNSPSDLNGQMVSLWNGTTQIGTAQFGTGSGADNATSTLSGNGLLVKKGDSSTIIVRGSLTAQDAVNGTHGAFLVVNYDGLNNGSATSATGNYRTGVDPGATIGGNNTAAVN